MNYVIRKRCAQKITTFYRNVSKKYKHTYSLDLMEKNINDAFDAIYQIKHARQLRLSEGRASLFILPSVSSFDRRSMVVFNPGR